MMMFHYFLFPPQLLVHGEAAVHEVQVGSCVLAVRAVVTSVVSVTIAHSPLLHVAILVRDAELFAPVKTKKSIV